MATHTWIDSKLTNDNLPRSIAKGDVVRMDWIHPFNNKYVLQPLYIREHLIGRKAVFDEFLAGEESLLYIAGPPGCGKTVFLFLVARMYAYYENKNVLFVGYRLAHQCPIFRFPGNGKPQELRPFPRGKKLDSVLENEVFADPDDPANQYDLVVHDGVREAKRDSMNCLSRINGNAGERGFKAVHVTSLAFRIRGGDVPREVYEKDYFDSWETPDEYTEAIMKFQDNNVLPPLLDTAIREHHNRRAREDELVEPLDEQSGNLSEAAVAAFVEEKYYFAGGSARFMLEYGVQQLKKDLKELLTSLKDEQWKALTSNIVPSATDGAVNSLMQRFSNYDGVTTVAAVSEFVAMAAYAKKGHELAQAIDAAANATRNPALKGWAFELKQLEEIKKALQQHGYVYSKDGIFFQPTHQVHYNDNEKILEGEINESNTTIILCRKWNQGCFDAAIYSNRTLVTVQFTTSSKHSVKFQYIRELKKACELEKGLKVDTIFHIGVNNEGNKICWDPKSGQGASHWDKDYEICLCSSFPLVGDADPTQQAQKENNFRPNNDSGETVTMYHKKRKHQDT